LAINDVITTSMSRFHRADADVPVCYALPPAALF
jgi:hypothetical protein